VDPSVRRGEAHLKRERALESSDAVLVGEPEPFIGKKCADPWNNPLIHSRKREGKGVPSTKGRKWPGKSKRRTLLGKKRLPYRTRGGKPF